MPASFPGIMDLVRLVDLTGEELDILRASDAPQEAWNNLASDIAALIERCDAAARSMSMPEAELQCDALRRRLLEARCDTVARRLHALLEAYLIATPPDETVIKMLEDGILMLGGLIADEQM